MVEDSGFASLRQAIAQAQVGTDADVDYVETETIVATIAVKQLNIIYKSGNEYLRLDRFYEALQRCGKVEVFEFRGRGREPNEQPTLVADVRIAGQRYQVIYHLPGGGVSEEFGGSATVL